MPNLESEYSGCPADCRGCPEDRVEALRVPGPLSGSKLALSSILTFLLPLATAVTGACWLRQDSVNQLAGGVGGLLLGMLAARLMVRLRSWDLRGAR